MVKNYDLDEYASQVEWRGIASNGVNLQKTKFSSSWQVEIENFKSISDKMMRWKIDILQIRLKVIGMSIWLYFKV